MVKFPSHCTGAPKVPSVCQERFEIMPGAKLLPRSPEVGWALRDEDGWMDGAGGLSTVWRSMMTQSLRISNGRGKQTGLMWVFFGLLMKWVR